MKNYVKGILTGFLIAAVVFAVPAIAVNLDAVLNAVRINVNGVDEIRWDEDITLSNGETAPASILYNGTTYLPMRKLGELGGQKIYWNGDSKTVSITGAQEDVKVIAEKPDKDGNMWTYYTFKTNTYNKSYESYKESCYLGVKDEVRGYERVYRMAGSTVRVIEDGIYFARLVYIHDYTPSRAEIVFLPFKNDKNTQDGEILDKISVKEAEFGNDEYLFFSDDDYLFYMLESGSLTSRYDVLCAYNYITGEEAEYQSMDNTQIFNLSLISSDKDNAVLTYTWYTPGPTLYLKITYDKTTNTFSEPRSAETEVTP